MNITQEPITDNHLRLKVNVKPEDYLPKVETGIKEYGKKMQMPGFRPGKVPNSLAKKMYGNQVLADELDKLLNQQITDYIKENNLNIFGQPLPYDNGIKDININAPGEYEFGFEIGLVPAFELPNLEEVSIDYNTPTVTDQMVDEEVEKLQYRYGTEEDITNPEDERSVMKVRFQELENNEPKAGGVDTHASFALRLFKDEETKAKAMQMKAGDSIDFNIMEAFGHDHDLIVHNLLRVDHAIADSMNPMFRMEAEQIKRVNKAEINAETLDKMFPPGTVPNEAALRLRIFTQMQVEFEKAAHTRLENKLFEFLTSSVNVPFPEGFLRKWVEANQQHDHKHDEHDHDHDHHHGVSDEEFGKILSRLKWDLIVDKLVKENNIEINVDDIRQAVKDDIVARYLGGNADPSMDELVEKLADNMMKDKDQIRRYTEQALFDKVFEWLETKVKVNAIPVSYHDFIHQA